MLTIFILLGVVLLGIAIVAIANKLDDYMNRDSSLNNEL